jgi:hypothetical protein
MFKSNSGASVSNFDLDMMTVEEKEPRHQEIRDALLRIASGRKG